jgi:DeoR/GlpR family transcriptional regulator of sugar metabolism
MNNTQDNIQKRREKILEYINQQGRTTVNELSEALQISSITVRRDLDVLAEEKKISRFFGGVRAISSISQKTDFSGGANTFAHMLLQRTLPPEKEASVLKIAKTAADLIENGDIVLLNNSLTASYVLDYLGDKSVTVITNCLFVLSRNPGPNVKLCFLGGQLQKNRAGMIGGIAYDTLSKISANKCIMGVDGIDIISGLTCKVLDESYVNQQMIQHTNGKLIVVAEGSRIANKSAFYSGNLKDVSFLITDDSADIVELSDIKNSGVNLHVVHPDH